jgi:O-antigen/teichoic acid export membrane protein
MASLCFSIVIVFGDQIFAILLGNSWKEAGYIASSLSFLYLFKFVSSPLSNLYLVLGKERRLLFFQITLFVVRVVSLIACWRLEYSAVLIIGIYSFTNAICYFVLSIRIFNNLEMKILSRLIKFLIWTFLLLVILLGVRFYLVKDLGLLQHFID